MIDNFLTYFINFFKLCKDQIEKPWGKEYILHHGVYVIKVLQINYGHKISYQYHEEKEETMIFLTNCEMMIEGETESCYRGEIKHIPKKMKHQITAKHNNVLVLEISTPHLEDVIRLDDPYNR